MKATVHMPPGITALQPVIPAQRLRPIDTAAPRGDQACIYGSMLPAALPHVHDRPAAPAAHARRWWTQYVCLSNAPKLCLPCTNSESCQGEMPGTCVTYGAGGSFCGASCDLDSPCPAGFDCQETTTTDLRRAATEAGYEAVERDTLYRRVNREGSKWSLAPEVAIG